MSIGRTERDDEIAAKIAELKIDKDTNWRELFDLPLDMQNTNALLDKFYTQQNFLESTTDNIYKVIHDSIKAVLHNPVQLREAISRFKLANFFPVMFYRHAHFTVNFFGMESLLDLIASPDCPAESMRMLLELIPQQLLPFTNMAINLVRYPEKLDIYLSMLNDHGRRLLFNIRHNNRDTILHTAAYYPAAFKKLLALTDDAELKLNAMLATNNYKSTPLQHAAEDNESFAAAFSQIPKHMKHAAAEMQSDNGKKLIHYAGTDRNAGKILEVYPPKELLDLLTTKPQYGDTAIAMACKNYDWLRSVLVELPRQDRSKAMSAAGERGRELLRKLAHEEPEKMLEVLSLYAEDERFKAITPHDFIDRKPEYIIRLMNLLPATNRERPEDIINIVNDKIQFLKGSYTAYASFLLAYAKNYSFKGAMKILDALPCDEDRLKSIYLSGRRGDAFLEFAAQCNPEYAEKMRDALDAYKDMLEMQSEMENYLDGSTDKSTPVPVKRDSQPMFGFFDPTSRFGEVPKNIPATMTVAEYKRL